MAMGLHNRFDGFDICIDEVVWIRVTADSKQIFDELVHFMQNPQEYMSASTPRFMQEQWMHQCSCKVLPDGKWVFEGLILAIEAERIHLWLNRRQMGDYQCTQKTT